MRLILLGTRTDRYNMSLCVSMASAIDLDQTVKNGLVKRKEMQAKERSTYFFFFIDRQVTLGTVVQVPLSQALGSLGLSLALSFLSIMLNEQTKPNWAFYVPICLIESKSNAAAVFLSTSKTLKCSCCPKHPQKCWSWLCFSW